MSIFDIIYYVQFDCNHLYTAKKITQILFTTYLYMWTPVHVSAINHHPLGDVNTKEYKINISNSHIHSYKLIITNINKKCLSYR